MLAFILYNEQDKGSNPLSILTDMSKKLHAYVMDPHYLAYLIDPHYQSAVLSTIAACIVT